MDAHKARAFLAAAALLISAGVTQAQDFPTRPVTLIVPFAAGGTTDIGLRALAAATEKHLGQRILIENRTGAGGVIGPLQMAANAAPDGYTISQIPITVFRYPFTARTPFNPITDLSYIISLSGYTFGIVVKPDAPWKTFQDLLADARTNPGKISYGSPGAGTTLHLTMEQIAKQQGIKWTHVPFRGTSDSTNALMGGHVSVVADASGWAPLVNSGKLRLLVIWSDKRSKSWPDAPTLKEAGVAMVSNSPFGLAGPKGMDARVVKALHDAFKKGMDEPAYVEVMTRIDQEPFYLNTEDYRAFAARTSTEQKQLMEELGLAQQ
ncbi:MAG: tripartite tricarboxylate transporter substrate binding protein [Xanthobacteraceae bacterium]|nr:tripartite tricarboxylate transporter substrate binding protein [Xanthobacteraceae bacterium]MBX9842547.1 tripartite tricarboxylate transporter substrate binding protein [Xanthobacteraceae bacterium]